MYSLGCSFPKKRELLEFFWPWVAKTSLETRADCAKCRIAGAGAARKGEAPEGGGERRESGGGGDARSMQAAAAAAAAAAAQQAAAHRQAAAHTARHTLLHSRLQLRLRTVSPYSFSGFDCVQAASSCHVTNFQRSLDWGSWGGGLNRGLVVKAFRQCEAISGSRRRK